MQNRWPARKFSPMEIFDGHRALFRPLFSPAIALGNFDGVHQGHRRLLAETVAASKRLGGDALVLTFDPHPAQVLAPERAPPLLTTRERKLELIAEAGMSACIVEPFTRELSQLSPEDFLKSILVDVIGVRHVVVGYDFRFGKQRAGTTDTLREFAAAHNFVAQIVEPVEVAGAVASSSTIRKFLRAGEVGEVGTLLGRDFDIDGTVVRGDGRGATIGVPTANVAARGDILPAPGVYAVRMRILDGDVDGPLPGRDAALSGVANLGRKPTFGDDNQLTLEVHALDFAGDLYGRLVRVEFVARLRGEQRFDGVEQLVAQIHRDIAQARDCLTA